MANSGEHDSSAASASFGKDSTQMNGHLEHTETRKPDLPLPLEDYARYGRQMIVPQVGLPGQVRLRSSRVLVVGLGGLGCPAAQYLAGAGVGTLGLMDGDEVELSNLHRQILHTYDNIGMNKAQSAFESLRRFNQSINYNVHPSHLAPELAIDTIQGKYDLMLDCTDRPSTRYMLSDIAVIAGIPLVTASALRTEGQLLVLNNPPNNSNYPSDDKGFCYRCVFPRPPPATSVQACSEAGILGPVVGTMGTLMATEAIKILTRPPPTVLDDEMKRMLIYSAYSDTPFRSIRLKGKRAACPSCGYPPEITRDSLAGGSADYIAFCGLSAPISDTGISFISARDLASKHNSNSTTFAPKPTTIIDVRNETEYGIAHLPHSTNIPLSQIQQNASVLTPHLEPHTSEIHFICRYGNDSRVAVAESQKFLMQRPNLDIKVFDVKGGLKAWKEDVDTNFPDY